MLTNKSERTVIRLTCTYTGWSYIGHTVSFLQLPPGVSWEGLDWYINESTLFYRSKAKAYDDYHEVELNDPDGLIEYKNPSHIEVSPYTVCDDDDVVEILY